MLRLTDELLNIEQNHFFTIPAEGTEKQCSATTAVVTIISQNYPRIYRSIEQA